MQRISIPSIVVLLVALPLAASEPFRFETNDAKEVVLYEGDSPLWQYNAAFRAVPGIPEKDARYLAGCYIHPLYGIDGEVLTDDGPRDHYHHHGVFWTWPHVLLHRSATETEKYDVWAGNTRLKQQFVRFGDKKTGGNSATFRVENGWFIAPEVNKFNFDGNGRPTDEKIMREEVAVTTHRLVERDGIRSRAVDLDFTWTVGKYPISLRGAEGKSYGGLTVRFHAPAKNPKPGVDAWITVPGGVAEKDLPETPLPWADYTAVFGRDAEGKPKGDRSGAAIFVPKSHPDWPPTWLTRYYGPLCVGWPGVEARKFEPGEVVRLSYRVWIHDGFVDAETLRKVYEEYGRPVVKRPKSFRRPLMRRVR